MTERRLDRHKWAWSTGTAPPSKALDSLSYLDLVARCEDSLVEQRPESGYHYRLAAPAIIQT
ncbi:MAG TPA: hypothetical protein VK754_11175 [Propionibacteriaceae bacterium]|nr:hypothetical protein [Propionibacteriaceae bacterium]